MVRGWGVGEREIISQIIVYFVRCTAMIINSCVNADAELVDTSIVRCSDCVCVMGAL